MNQYTVAVLPDNEGYFVLDPHGLKVAQHISRAETAQLFADVLNETRAAEVDAEHMRTSCITCGECTICNVRPCSPNGTHTPRNRGTRDQNSNQEVKA